jgi:hypothetical protein
MIIFLAAIIYIKVIPETSIYSVCCAIKNLWLAVEQNA